MALADSSTVPHNNNINNEEKYTNNQTEIHKKMLNVFSAFRLRSVCGWLLIQELRVVINDFAWWTAREEVKLRLVHNWNHIHA